MATFLTGTQLENIEQFEQEDFYLDKESEFRSRAITKKSTKRGQLPRVCNLYKTMKKRKKVFQPNTMNYLKLKDHIEDLRESDDTGANIRPGVRFWNYLAEANPKIKKPKIWIPHTYVNIGSNSQYWLWTDPSTGKMKCVPDATYNEFERQIEKNKKLISEKGIDEGERKRIESDRKHKFFIAYRRYQNDYDTTTDVHPLEKWSQVRSSASGIKDNSLVQEFIYPQGKHVSMTRLIFHTKHNKQLEANYAFKLRNKLTLVYEGKDQDKKSIRERTTVDKGKDGSFTKNKITGPGLFSLESAATKLVDFLERAYPVRIFKIVIDFVTGDDKINYMFNVAHIEKEIMGQIGENKAEKKRTLDELTCSVYCKLCGLIFKKDEASKTLTYKLLWELSQHLKKRGRQLNDIEVSHSSTRPCRVCDLCYMVVVSEHELIELEQQFAKAQNIPIKDPYLRVPVEKKAKHRPALLSEVLKQWRFMIYMEYLYFEPEDQFIFEELGVNLNQVHLQIKLFNVKNDFVLGLKEVEIDKDKDMKQICWEGRKVYKINLLRVYYYFSESIDITRFLSETDLHIRLTHTKDWNNYIAHGSSKTLSNFQNSREMGQKHESRVFLFFDNARYCTLKIMAGLVCDGDFNTASMNLHKSNGVYFPDEDFYNCNMFPEEWIEIFFQKPEKRGNTDEDSEEEYLNGIDDADQEANKIQPYTPVCTKAELRKMLEGNVKKANDDVESKTDHYVDVEALRARLKRFKDKHPNRPYSRYVDAEESAKSNNFRITGAKQRPMTSMPENRKKDSVQRAISSMRPNQLENYEEIDQKYKDEINQRIHEHLEDLVDDDEYDQEEEQEEYPEYLNPISQNIDPNSEIDSKRKEDIGTTHIDHEKFLKSQLSKLERDLKY